MIATFIALVGAAGAVLFSSPGASARAPIAARFPPGLLTPSRTLPLSAGKPLAPHAIQAIKPHALPARPLLLGPTVCYVGLPSCSKHPCLEYVSPATSSRLATLDGAVYAPAPPVTRSQCRPATPKLQPVGAPIAAASAVAVRSTHLLTVK